MNRQIHVISRTISLVLAVCLPLLIPPGKAAAQSAGVFAGESTGTVTGRVQNSDTGQFLVNARVSVIGSNRQAFTDETGIFWLNDLPAGPVDLQVFYTGLPTEKVRLSVKPGAIVNQEVFLSSIARGPDDRGVVKLDAFKVTAESEMTADALAVNEQRFAGNIKSVLAADAFGDISEGNVGEFLKYMPSIQADFADPQIASVTVRGLASNLTQVSTDGAQMANAHTGGASRVFQFYQVSMNNLSRIELTKVPTPSDPADSMGGIINLISKSAFERKTPQFNYRMFFTGAKDNISLKRMKSPQDKLAHRILPSVEFSYIMPVNDRFGITVSSSSLNRYDERHVAAKVFNTSLANTAASVSNPFMQSFTLQDAPRYTYRDSINVKADWRVTPNSVLSATLQYGDYLTRYSMSQMVANTGTNAVPTAGGQALSWGADHTHGATGRGSMTLDGQNYVIDGATKFGNLRYRFDNGDWQIKAGGSWSKSKTAMNDTEAGQFYSTTNQLIGLPGFVGSLYTVDFLDISQNAPGSIRFTDAAGKSVDITDAKNYRLTAATSVPRLITNEVYTVDASVRRRIHSLPFPLAVEIGGAQRYQKFDTRRKSEAYTYNGPDGNASTWDHSSDYLSDMSRAGRTNRDFGFAGITDLPWFSPVSAYAAWQANPTLFSQTLAQQVSGETFRRTNSELFEETVNAGYFLVDGRFIRNRLRVLAGVRYEQTIGEGAGLLTDPNGVWVRDADGSFAHDSKGARIRKPEAGAAGSLQQLDVTLFERGSKRKRTYDGYYPSANMAYNITENFMARFAYARTYGRPNVTSIIPNMTINEFDLEGGGGADGVLGTISVRNTALRPWVADNYDYTLEYYTNSGGAFTAGVFNKQIDGFFQTVVKVVNEEDLIALGLDPMYAGYQLSTQYNLGKGSVKGYEFSARQPLAVFGTWGKPFDVFANASYFTDISGLNGRTINAGVTIRLDPITFSTKVNYRTGRRGAAVAAMGTDAYEYEGDRTAVDVTISWILRKYISIFAGGSNIFNNDPTAERYGAETPDYAKRFRVQQFGAQYQLGVRGTF
ncbi:MAG: TonB-dependent receptor [Opitutaceae bacterium]|nr:TonB-dependent receptor [Opitutaceae bacterium]